MEVTCNTGYSGLMEKFSLNETQKQAVEHKEGAMLILAGAGAGKTRVITERIKRLIEKGIAPERILAVTFTNKAAREMRERVALLLNHTPGEAPRRRPADPLAETTPFISTFHALGVHILRAHAREVGLTRSFTIFDRGDSIRAIKNAMERVDVNPKEFEPKKVLGAISRAKGDAITLEQYRADAHDFFPRIVARIWEPYAAALRSEKALDFDDLLLATLELLKRNERVRAYYQDRWHYLHIDEYQDTNEVQYQIANLLAAPHNNICVVADPDQNIYSWRGANLENVFEFERAYPERAFIVLEENYRSTQTILDAANTIIKKNKRRKEKNLFTKNGAGEKIKLVGLYDEIDEARFVAQTAAERIKSGVPAREIAVLYRANFQSRALEEAFLMYEVPYQVLGVRFFERREIKDMLSFIRAALNPDSLSDLRRVINVPARGIGKVTFLKVASGKEHELRGKVRESVAQFRELLVRIRESAQTQKPSLTVLLTLRASGLETELKAGGEEELERLENIRELVTLATRYDHLEPLEGIEKLLEDAALASDQDELKEDRDAVKLMTVHAAKGLEFDTVFVTGLEEGLFPHRALSEDRIDDEEERRLFYVALTRARKMLYLTYASVRTIFGSREVNILSEFVTDLEERQVELIDPNAEKERSPEQTIYID